MNFGRMYNDEIEKANVLVEALPYIKHFSGKIVVIKYGGKAMENEQIKTLIMQDIVLMKYVGLHPVVVHGGGPEINKMLKRVNIESNFVNGLRVTDRETMEIVEMVLVGKINKEITSLINKHGGNAVGLSGKDANLLIAEKDISNGDIGYVGEIIDINKDFLMMILENGYIPVIAPCAIGRDGNTYNVNADTAAGKIASILKAEKFVLLTDVSGVLKDRNDERSIISKINYQESKELLNSHFITEGMIPKLKCCVKAIEEGVESAHIIDGRIPHSLILEIFTKEGIGTMIVKENSYEEN
ncbi:MAG: acetylglutamate kinase [Defluviitoga tunisiensis]|jgi:acetylglutamate kinase|uniref:Acetylglutamate kinase n=1 Tax=Defluviitoga tunisiensis TaxID=1006576 RepID=A0A0C7NLJ1_DEFTU|nr:acetylglutamate kinase [Defluviitoga tunisiensis]MDD3600210.1 acetylglutamate kinase [Defluviitoga tunisiensis]MDY0379345.1 acetylglutamate kinase [Defluviitoga tunisiensis]CEP78756.1 Acetylglutamate kinase [Defluviitoga tunisiensis]HHV01095.1 acetylglutamate kinase [Defluviitoga tunisiensis]HOB54634.1 acetylglutamate kinase [Defluviitoga tunisiensis]